MNFNGNPTQRMVELRCSMADLTLIQQRRARARAAEAEPTPQFPAEAAGQLAAAGSVELTTPEQVEAQLQQTWEQIEPLYKL
jgi:hypothetical protein